MEIRVWSAKFSLLWREVFDFMQVFLLMHALPEKQVIFFPEYGNNPPFLSIRQVLHNGLEDRNYQIQEPGPVEHPITSFVVWRRLFHNSIYAYCFYSSPVYTILKNLSLYLRRNRYLPD